MILREDLLVETDRLFPMVLQHWANIRGERDPRSYAIKNVLSACRVYVMQHTLLLLDEDAVRWLTTRLTARMLEDVLITKWPGAPLVLNTQVVFYLDDRRE